MEERRDPLDLLGGASHQGVNSDVIEKDASSNWDQSERQSTANGPEEIVLAKNEDKAVRWTRFLMLLVLVAVAVTVSFFVHRVTSDAEIETFEQRYTDQALKIVEGFETNADRRLAALQGFSQSITTHAVDNNLTFPFVALPDFERQAAYALKLSDVAAIMIFPIVETEDRQEWEAFSIANQGWLNEGLAVQEEVMGSILGEQDDLDFLQDKFDQGGVLDDETAGALEQESITPIIYKLQPGTTIAAPETGAGPYAPIWQLAPAFPAHRLINFNSFSYPPRVRELNTLLKTQSLLMSSAADFKDEDPLTANRKTVLNLFLNRWKNGTFEYEDGPVSDVYVPIFDSNGPEKEMKSVLTAYVYWQSYFTNLLPEDAKGIIVTLKNTCNQSFSYEINGKDVSYLGQGDFHDDKYNNLMVETGLGAVLGANNVPDEIDSAETGQCYYNVQVYQVRPPKTSSPPRHHCTFRLDWRVSSCLRPPSFCCMMALYRDVIVL